MLEQLALGLGLGQMNLTADVDFGVPALMTKSGKIILIALVATAAPIGAAIQNAITVFFPSEVYVCDFRLISAATCDLPMAAHTTRVTPTHADAERTKHVARRDRIVACEREKTAKRRTGEPVPAQKCWDESPTFLVSVSSR